MKPKILTVITLLLIVLLILFTEHSMTVRETGDPHSLIGTHLPPMKVKTASGEELQLSGPERTNGMLIFFSTKCEYCLEELLFWEGQGSALNGAMDFRFISVDPPEETVGFLAEHSIDLPVCTAQQDDVRKHFHISRVPSLFVTDTAGVITGYFSGSIDKKSLSNALSELLHERIEFRYAK